MGAGMKSGLVARSLDRKKDRRQNHVFTEELSNAQNGRVLDHGT